MSPGGSGGQRSGRILIVDDARDRALLMVRILRKAGHTVWTVGTGEAALGRLDEIAPDLVLLDVVLPGLSGFDTCRRIRASSAHRGLRLIIFSGLAVSSETQAEGLEAGADGYLAWPVSPRELVARVSLALRTSATQRALPPDPTTPPEPGPPPLTPRQREVVAHVAEGRTSTETAQILGISPATVETHRKAAMRRLGVHSTADLVRYALLNGIAPI
jgi:DNA-binding NarL/FixJ family response regulator